MARRFVVPTYQLHRGTGQARVTNQRQGPLPRPARLARIEASDTRRSSASCSRIASARR